MSMLFRRPLFRHCAIAVGRAASTTCTLCDVETEDWLKHSNQPQHLARHAVCAALVSPERHELVMKQLWEHIQLDFSQLDDVSEMRIAKRRNRLRSTLTYLKQVEVLSQSLVYAEEVGVCVKPRFLQFAVLGESQLLMETSDRVARLLPKLSGQDLSNIVSFILCQRHLVQMFDAIGVATATAPESVTFTNEQKAAVLLSIYGELAEFNRRQHSHDVANKAAADRLVGNVLASHALENIASELVHTVLQKIVDEGTPVWNQYKTEITDKLKEGSSFAAPALSSVKSPQPKEISDAGVSKWQRELSPSARTVSGGNLRLKMSWNDLLRVSTLDITVPNPVSKSAFYAATTPRLSAKPKNPPK